MMSDESMFPGQPVGFFPRYARKLLALLPLETFGSETPGKLPMLANTHITEYTILPDGATLQDKNVRHYLITVRYHHDDQYCLFSQNRRWNGKYWSPILDRIYPESTFHFPRDDALTIASSIINKITYYGMTYQEYSNRD